MEPRRIARFAPLSRTTSTGGVILGKYELGRLLGRGSFAKVFHGRSLSDNITVAVKVIDKSKIVDTNMEPRISRSKTASYTPHVVLRRTPRRKYFEGRGYDGAKADAWSCGVILFVFLAGSLPFDDSNIPNMYQKIHRREFQFPAWISKPAKYIISQLLDPNPNTRMSIEVLMGLSWFKKSLRTESRCCSLELDLVSGKDCKYTLTMNAFDIISMSSGLDLSGLFETSANQREKRFTSKASVELIEERLTQVGEKLGFRAEKGKSGAIGLVNMKSVVLAKILEVSPELMLVEVKVVDGWEEFEQLHWNDMKTKLEDIVLSWHNDVS
ncbi:hypothetical protein F0562_035442 [Nyssa sinensis]|uniref:non-specific serine/threonine protein kinase n=1 Tax=Nyssa sinensis TaxID=561372 RepID=A0A5J5ABM1_9ASTE|nr:hypothetical protein F0562_035442 [Nyssa sinensis]